MKKAAKMAAKWWADRLHENHAAKREAFAGALARVVNKGLRREKRVWLENDYDPNTPLLEALAEVGIECRGCMFSGDGIFPRKHELAVYSDRLEPKEGYGNWLEPVPVR